MSKEPDKDSEAEYKKENNFNYQDEFWQSIEAQGGVAKIPSVL